MHRVPWVVYRVCIGYPGWYREGVQSAGRLFRTVKKGSERALWALRTVKRGSERARMALKTR